MNISLVQWFSKKQPTVEISVFGTDFVTMEQGMDAPKSLRYKLKIMSITISGFSYIYGDNMLVAHNTTKPETVLKKKCNSVCYNTVHELVAIRESLVRHIPSSKNVTDLMTEILYGKRQKYLVRHILHDVHKNH